MLHHNEKLILVMQNKVAKATAQRKMQSMYNAVARHATQWHGCCSMRCNAAASTHC